ncbi:hypothetical protein ABK040_012070 [Willaertia magna]
MATKPSLQKKFDIIVGVDLGTSRSGISIFELTRNTKEPKTHYWQDPIYGNTPKNLSLLLFNERKKTTAFGFEAEKRFVKEELQGKKSYLAIKFKNELYNNPDLNCIMEINGESFKVVSIISTYLIQLMEPILNTIIRPSDLNAKYVFTIPANWQKSHVDVLKEAIIQSGIFEEPPKDDNLIFVLEPEAAAVCCHKENILNIKNGTEVLLIDAGGGTVDFCSFEIENQKLKMTDISEAINYGSSILDTRMFSKVHSLIGDNLFNSLSIQQKFSMFCSWESQKLKLNDLNSRIIVKIENPSLDIQKHPLFKVGGILLDSNCIKEIYEEVLDEILNKAESKFNTRQYDHIVMVGGFSQCKPLIDKMKDKFGYDVVLVPNSGSDTIVRGAAYLGLDPSLIAVRKCKYTYGIESEREFDPSIDDEKRLKMSTSASTLCRFMCSGIFSPLIIRNEEIKNGFCVERLFYKLEDVPQMNIDVYQSFKEEVEFVDDSSCIKLCQIKVDVSNIEMGQHVTVKFVPSTSNTHLDIKVLTCNGKQAQASIKFDNYFSFERFK